MEKQNLTEECFLELEKFKALSSCFLVRKFKIDMKKAHEIMQAFEDNGVIDKHGKLLAEHPNAT